MTDEAAQKPTLPTPLQVSESNGVIKQQATAPKTDDFWPNSQILGDQLSPK